MPLTRRLLLPLPRGNEDEWRTTQAREAVVP